MLFIWVFKIIIIVLLAGIMSMAPLLHAREINTDTKQQELSIESPALEEKGVAVEIGAAGNIRKENTATTRAERLAPLHIHTLWESRYITEGRDNLSGDAIYSLSTDISYNKFTIAPWFAYSAETDYKEANLNIVYGWKVAEHWEIYTNYTYINARGRNAGKTIDGEIGIEWIYTGLDAIDISNNLYYSFDADGVYLETTLSHVEKFNGVLSYTFALITGVNGGYVTDGHNGIDHIQAKASMLVNFTARLDMFLYISADVAINRQADRYAGDESLGSRAWGGVGISYRF